MVFNGDRIVNVKGPSLAQRLSSRIPLRDSTNGTGDPGPKARAISRRLGAPKKSGVMKNSDNVATESNLDNNE